MCEHQRTDLYTNAHIVKLPLELMLCADTQYESADIVRLLCVCMNECMYVYMCFLYDGQIL
jgi:hypothetical protein